MRRNRLFCLSLVVLLLSACSGAPQAQAPTAAPAQPTTAPQAQAPTAAPAQPTAAPAPAGTPTEDETKQGIQAALDLYAQAYNENKPELLKQAADQTNAKFRRFIQTRFDTFQESIRAGSVTFGYTVESIEPRDFGFVMAKVDAGGGVYDWSFRQVNGRWVMSEPTEDQLGKREKIADENFTFYVYPWSKVINEKLMDMMRQARATVQERLGKVPDQKADVYIRPIFGVGGIESPNALAYYDRSNRAGDRFVIYAPESYVFGAYDPAEGWEPNLESTLVHEYTHMTNNRSFTQIARMSDWMVEGLAEYVSDPTSAQRRSVPLAVRNDTIIPIVDTSGKVNKQDLEHLTILEKDVSLAYGLAASLVDFIVQKHGGLDGWWKFVAAYDKAQKLDTALQQAFGLTYEQFDAEWRAWLKQKYG